MSPKALLLGALANLVVHITATPLTLNTRACTGSDCTTVEGTGSSSSLPAIDFAPTWPTCGNDETLGLTKIASTTKVQVQPDCDVVINDICRAVDVETQSDNATMTSLSAINGTCEGHVLFDSGDVKLTNDVLNYTSCVKSFQGITEMCMLLDTKGNYASVGKQFGVQNIFYGQNPVTKGIGISWSPSQKWGNLPGYMIGPVGVFGNVDGDDARRELLGWENKYKNSGGTCRKHCG